jgi:anti-sigma regulatory factor (Ser/Thr protein kinase)
VVTFIVPGGGDISEQSYIVSDIRGVATEGSAEGRRPEDGALAVTQAVANAVVHAYRGRRLRDES